MCIGLLNASEALTLSAAVLITFLTHPVVNSDRNRHYYTSSGKRNVSDWRRTSVRLSLPSFFEP